VNSELNFCGNDPNAMSRPDKPLAVASFPVIYSAQTLTFLQSLASNNHRDWFQSHQQDYERVVREPSLQLIRELEKPLDKLAPFFPAVAKKVGGSLMRIHRDVRFSGDKSPYKTNVGIQFRHAAGKDVHAPGFYLHIEPQNCFIGAGCWRPAGATLVAIRQAIVEDSRRWLRVRNDKTMRADFHFAGESLKTAPRGYAKDHPRIEDLRRKDFLIVSPLEESTVTSAGLIPAVLAKIKAARPWMRFLCLAARVPF